MHSYQFVLHNGVLRPWVPVRFATLDKSIVTNIFWSLVDTGADKSLFPQIVPEICKYDLKSGKTENMQGIEGGAMLTWSHPFIIQLMSNNHADVVWESQPFEIACVEHSNNPPILGFREFISNFKLTVDFKNKTTGLEEYLTLDQKLQASHKVGRNDPCTCGSGKKYQNCHGKSI